MTQKLYYIYSHATREEWTVVAKSKRNAKNILKTFLKKEGRKKVKLSLDSRHWYYLFEAQSKYKGVRDYRKY